ncbi:MAG: CDP-alcohol phosphatidyltransferase family protein [Acidimicrobiia bacterium]|nr:CDP-alcohol phosphatidyltransferase family protein [Acidimicrobiia bacterium]
MFDGRFRHGVERGLGPVGSALRRLGVTADHVTAAGLVVSVAAGLAVAAGWLIAGLLLLAVSGALDLLDGAVAKASSTSTPRGAFFDSVADRVSDAFVLGGVAWYLAGWKHGHTPVLALAVLAASMLISYERARAEALGFQARGGLMERAERMFLLGVGLAFGVVLVPVLWVMLVLTCFTAVQRFVRVWRQATVAHASARPPARWRTWRPLSDADEGSWRARRAERRRVRTRP